MAELLKLGIFAGGGMAPRKVIEACQRDGRPFFVFCLQGQADKDLAEGLPHAWVFLGQGSKLKDLISREQIKEVVMIGYARRPSLKEIKPDWLALKTLLKIGFQSLGDDGLLRAIGREVEQVAGVRMVGAHEIVPDFLMPEGVLTKIKPDTQALEDIRRGTEIAEALGLLDVGQAVVVQQGLVLGVEAIEGTDALLKRVSSLSRSGEGGVLVKMAKPQQDDRYDLPTIGSKTIEAAKKAGLRGIAFGAGRGIILDRVKTVDAADKAKMFLVGV